MKDIYSGYKSLSDVFKNNFLPFGGLPFCFLNSFFGTTKVFNLDEVHFIFLSFYSLCFFVSSPRNLSQTQRHKNSLLFFSWKLIILAPTFTSVINFELILCIMWGKGHDSLFSIWLVIPLFHPHWVKTLSLHWNYFGSFVENQLACLSVGLFLDSTVLCLYVCRYASTTPSWFL